MKIQISGFLPLPKYVLYARGRRRDRNQPWMSDIEQFPAWKRDTLPAMTGETRILKVEKDGEDGVIVTFSDGTMGGYVVEELLALRPIREEVEGLAVRTPSPKPATQN